MRRHLRDPFDVKAHRRILGPLLVAATFLVAELHALAAYQRVQYRYGGNRRPPPTNETTKPKPAEPAEKPVKFRDLPLNAEFYYIADKERKLFPWKKISATQAQSVVTASNPKATVATVPIESLVVVKGPNQNKDQPADKKGAEGKNKS